MDISQVVDLLEDLLCELRNLNENLETLNKSAQTKKAQEEE